MAEAVKRTYDNIMRLGYYKSASIIFTEIADSTIEDNFISFGRFRFDRHRKRLHG